jgi:hypothetical protein
MQPSLFTRLIAYVFCVVVPIAYIASECIKFIFTISWISQLLNSQSNGTFITCLWVPQNLET